MIIKRRTTDYGLRAAGLFVGLVGVAAFASACGKTPGGETSGSGGVATAVPDEARTIGITGTAPSASGASASASASGASASASASGASASASASASAGASASASASAGKASASAKGLTASASASAKEGPPLKPASTRVSGKNFTLDAASPGCRTDTPCTMTLRIAATGEYHMNKEYPYKFTAAAAPAVTFLGNGDANIFSRAAGDFREDGEKAGTLTVRFKPSAPGEAKVTGTYKLSVCSAENCQIEQQTVSLAVPVM